MKKVSDNLEKNWFIYIIPILTFIGLVGGIELIYAIDPELNTDMNRCMNSSHYNSSCMENAMSNYDSKIAAQGMYLILTPFTATSVIVLYLFLSKFRERKNGKPYVKI